MSRKQRFLLNVPALSNQGGVASYYVKMAYDQEPDVRCIQMPSYRGVLRPIFILLWYVRFFVSAFGVRVVLINPSMNRKAFLRDFILVVLARLGGAKVVAFWHGWDHRFAEKIGNSTGWLSLARKGYAQLLDGWIFLGAIFQKEAEMLFQVPLVGRSMITSMPFADPIDQAAVFSERDRQSASSILFLARAEVDKGVVDVVRIAIALRRLRGPEGWRVDICGNGRGLEEAKDLASADGIQELVHFHGDVRGKVRLRRLAEASVFLLPSRREGFPNSLVEALGFGHYVISTDVGAIREKLEGTCSWVAPLPVDPEEWAKRANEVLNDPVVLASARNINPSVVADRFDQSTLRRGVLSFVRRIGGVHA